MYFLQYLNTLQTCRLYRHIRLHSVHTHKKPVSFQKEKSLTFYEVLISLIEFIKKKLNLCNGGIAYWLSIGYRLLALQNSIKKMYVFYLLKKRPSR